jgi:drug/metabolite transporter (DMT)-like permease
MNVSHPSRLVSHPSRLLLVLAFTAVYIIWGTTYLAMRFGMLGIPPFMLCLLRYALVAGILVAWMGIKGFSFPSIKNTRILSSSGLLMLVGGTGLVVTAEQYINSGATATVIATEPLLFLLFDRTNRKSYSFLTLMGIVLGFAGIFLFSKFTSSHGDALSTAGSSDVWKGTGMVLVSAVFWVLGTLQSRRQANANHSPVASAAVQHIAGALGCLPIVLARGEWTAFHPSQVPAAAWLGLAYLVIMGSLVAFMAFMWLVKVQPPAVVSTHTYVNPVVAVIAGWILVGETINFTQVLALAMVLFGVLLVQSPRLLRVKLRLPRPGQTSPGRTPYRSHSQPWS